MSIDKPVENVIQEEEAAQLKVQTESLISQLKSVLYDAQDQVLDDLNHGLPAHEIWSSFVRHAKSEVGRVLNQAGFSFGVTQDQQDQLVGQDRITGHYTKLRIALDHLQQSPDNPQFQSGAETIWRELRTLQEQEAEEIKYHYRKSLELPLGRAQEILSHVERLKKEYANPPTTDATAKGAD